MMDNHMDSSVYRSTWATFLPRFPVNPSARVNGSYPVKMNCIRDVRQNTRQQHTRYSTSLSKARKLRRDRARMAAFIWKKTAENLPFSSLNNDDLQILGTNTSLRGTSRRPTVSASTQTGSEDIPLGQHDDKVENEQLRQEIQLLKDELSAAVQSVEEKDMIAARSSESIKKLQERNDHLFALVRANEQSYWTFQTEINNLKTELDNAKSMRLQLEGYCVTYKEQISEARSEIDDLQMTLSQYEYCQEQQTYEQNNFHGYQHRGRRNRRGR